jgi:hypothetical protein
MMKREKNTKEKVKTRRCTNTSSIYLLLVREKMIGKKKRKEKRPIECTDSFHSGDIYVDCKQKRTMIALRRNYYAVYY